MRGWKMMYAKILGGRRGMITDGANNRGDHTSSGGGDGTQKAFWDFVQQSLGIERLVMPEWCPLRRGWVEEGVYRR